MSLKSDQNGVHVAPVTDVDDEIAASFAELLPHLGDVRVTPDRAQLAEIVRSGATTLLVARDGSSGNRVVGALALVMFRIPSGLNAIIEDVVVDSVARGKGVGSALVNAAIAIARERGAKKVDLTSRPEREAANRLYPKLGFVKRNTTVYRYTIDGV